MWFLPKDYVSVATRVDKYHTEHQEGMSIETNFELNGDVAIFKATVKTKKWTFTWSSFWKLWKEKAFEKLETVAVWRALAFAGYETISWIASREEMENFEEVQKEKEEIWLNYEEFVAIVEAGNTTEEAIARVIREDWYRLSQYAKNAVRHYCDTWEIRKDLFFKAKNDWLKW